MTAAIARRRLKAILLEDRILTPDDYECPHDWAVTDDSFDHEFGTHHVEPYLECNVCGETAPMPSE